MKSMKRNEKPWACVLLYLSQRIESAVQTVRVDVTVRVTEVRIKISIVGALRQGLHVFIWGRGVSQDNPRYLLKGHNEVRREGKKMSQISQSYQELTFQISHLFNFIILAMATRFSF